MRMLKVEVMMLCVYVETSVPVGLKDKAQCLTMSEDESARAALTPRDPRDSCLVTTTAGHFADRP